MAPPAPLSIFNTQWYFGMGSKNRMKSAAAAATPRHKCLLQLQDPDSGGRHFASYPTWDDAIRNLRALRGNRRHLFEIIAHGKPCKPYLDLDGPPLPTEAFATVEDLIEHADRVIVAIFENDYGITLRPQDHLIWLVSPQPSKLSLHLVVCTHGPQWAFSSNHQTHPNGASHLAQRIRQLDPERLGQIVDMSVYTKDREMRAVGASKFGKPGSALVPFRGAPSPKDSLITCFDEGDQPMIIKVPGHIPRAARTRQKQKQQTETDVDDKEAIAERGPGPDRALVITRMLDLLRDGLHPSAVYDRRGNEDPYDPAKGIKV